MTDARRSTADDSIGNSHYAGGAPARPSTSRVGPVFVEWVRDRLSERDWQIIATVNQLRVATGEQLERLWFSSVPSARSRVVSRGRVLRRLVAWRALVPLERRIGGAGRGSSGAVFALDSVGHRLVAAQQQAAGQAVRVRRPGAPTDRTLTHMLAVAELYVGLVELSRSAGFTVAECATEPGCWWPNGLGGFIKPDVYLRLELGEVVDHWWVEHDQATESLPTVRRKLAVYLDFVRRGQLGPGGVIPRVLLSTISEPRRAALEGLVSRLPPPAEQLIAVSAHHEAGRFISEALKE